IPHPSFVVISTPRYLKRFTNSIGKSLYFILGYGGATTSCTSSAFVLFILTGSCCVKTSYSFIASTWLILLGSMIGVSKCFS
ncbi:unnamed protein product, partial [Rotaria sp. Silwood2]